MSVASLHQSAASRPDQHFTFWFGYFDLETRITPYATISSLCADQAENYRRFFNGEIDLGPLAEYNGLDSEDIAHFLGLKSTDQ